MHSALRIVACFFMLTALAHMGTASSLDWVPADQRKKVNLGGKLQTLQGEKVSLKDLKGKVLFLNFWATWCGPCRREMPDIEKMQQQLAEQGVEVAMLSSDTAEDVQAYLEKTPFQLRFLLDPQDELAFRMKVEVLPTTVVVDTRGRAALIHVGAYDWASPEAIEQLRRLAQE